MKNTCVLCLKYEMAPIQFYAILCYALNLNANKCESEYTNVHTLSELHQLFELI